MLSNMKFLAGDNGNDHDDNAAFFSCSFSCPIFTLNFNSSLINIIRVINMEREITIMHRNSMKSD
jgi:hypothetical protein